MIYNIIAWLAILVCIIGIIFVSIYAIFSKKRGIAKKILKNFFIALGMIVIIFFSFRLYLKYFHGVGEGEEIEDIGLFSFGSVCGPGLKAVEADTLISFNGSFICGIPMCNCYVCTKCGDGICGKGENHCNCPKDCKEGEGVYVEPSDPQINSMGTIGNTLELGGRIKGTWFSEGQLPAKLLDANGNFVAEGRAVAKGEWMTEDKVQFKVSFPNTNVRSGSLLLSKDNTSGLPQNNETVSIPFDF